MKNNSGLGWKLIICASGLAVNFVRSNLHCNNHNVSSGALLLLFITSNFFLDSIYHLVLKKQHEYISTLQERWPTPLTSTVRYTSEACATSELATSLSGTTIIHALQWLSPVVCELPSDRHVSEASDLDTIVDVESEDLGQIALADHLLEDVCNNVDGSVNKDDEEMEPMKISLDWQIPSVSDMIFVWNFLTMLP